MLRPPSVSTRVCAARSAATVATTASTIASPARMRSIAARLFRFGNVGRARARRAHEQPASVLENQVAPVRAVGAGFRAITFDRDFHAGLDGLAREAAA